MELGRGELLLLKRGGVGGVGMGSSDCKRGIVKLSAQNDQQVYA